MNREQKRALKKRGELDDEGEPTSQRRQAPAQRHSEPRPSVGQYLGEVRSELRKVAWPSREEVTNYSIVVLITLIIVTTFIGVLDWFLGEALLKLFER
ncbi:MAG: preprotein translocase subunit SecE [Acidimicrobiales bacterium]